jgi:FKBP-type peptidyl-prolyl cis-trans isomerase (trigger factor)
MVQLNTINDTESELVVSVSVSDAEYQKEYDKELSGISKTAKFD